MGYLTYCPFVCRLLYAGDNFVRHTGDVKKFAKQQCEIDSTNDTAVCFTTQLLSFYQKLAY